MSQFTSIIRSSRGGAKKIFLPNWSPFKLFESMLSCHSTHIHYTTGHSDFVKPGFNNFNVPQYSAVWLLYVQCSIYFLIGYDTLRIRQLIVPHWVTQRVTSCFNLIMSRSFVDRLAGRVGSSSREAIEPLWTTSSFTCHFNHDKWSLSLRNCQFAHLIRL